MAAIDHIPGSGRRCRCPRCRIQATVDKWRYRERNADATRTAAQRGEVRIVDGITHGIAGYRNTHCRCEVCRAANKAACVAYRQRRKAMADG